MEEVGDDGGSKWATAPTVVVTARARLPFSVKAPNHNSSVTETVVNWLVKQTIYRMY